MLQTSYYNACGAKHFQSVAQRLRKTAVRQENPPNESCVDFHTELLDGVGSGAQHKEQASQPAIVAMESTRAAQGDAGIDKGIQARKHPCRTTTRARVRGSKQRKKRRGGETTLDKGDEKSKAKGNAGNAQGGTSTDRPQELTAEAVYLTTSARTQTRDATLVRHAPRCLTATTQSTDT